MIFRDINGKLVEINRHIFKNDKLYYEKIMQIKNNKSNNKMVDLFKNKETYSSNLINKIIMT
jgi:hypothetical protein